MSDNLRDLVKNLQREEDVKKAEAEAYGHNSETVGVRDSRGNLPRVRHVRVLFKRAADRSAF